MPGAEKGTRAKGCHDGIDVKPNISMAERKRKWESQHHDCIDRKLNSSHNDERDSCGLCMDTILGQQQLAITGVIAD
jgi:hypothetical protein